MERRPTWDDYTEILKENRRKDQELFNEQLDLEEAAEEIANGTKARWQIVKPERWDLADAIGYICARPKMLFRHGSFSEGAAYLNGFAAGRGEAVQNELSQFNQWLAARAYEADGTARNLAWVCYIEQLYPYDEHAFAELPVLFDKFQAEYYSTSALPEQSA